MRNVRRLCSIALVAVVAMALIVAVLPAAAQDLWIGFTPPSCSL